jgi:hypothetical protein
VGAGRRRRLADLDEARDSLPAGTARPPDKRPLIRLFARGRQSVAGCLLGTRSLRSVDADVFGDGSTRLVGRLVGAQDLERVAEWFGKGGPTPVRLSGRKGAPRAVTWPACRDCRRPASNAK